MVIFLYGEDAYRIKQNVDLIAESYLKKHKSGLNLLNINLNNSGSIDTLLNASKSLSFFDEIKLVSISGIFKDKKTASDVLDLISDKELSNRKDIVLLIHENLNQKDMNSANKDLFKLLNSSKNMVREFSFLSGIKLENWIKSEFAKQKLVIDSTATKKLVLNTGSESWKLKNSIDILSNYSRSGKITVSDVDLLVYKNEEPNIFSLIDAIASKDKAKAFALLYKELKGGMDPNYVLSMVAFQFRNLVMVKDLAAAGLNHQAIAKKTSLHPFVSRKAVAASSKFSAEDLRLIYSKLADMDVLSKSGIVNLEDSLFGLVLN